MTSMRPKVWMSRMTIFTDLTQQDMASLGNGQQPSGTYALDVRGRTYEDMSVVLTKQNGGVIAYVLTDTPVDLGSIIEQNHIMATIRERVRESYKEASVIPP